MPYVYMRFTFDKRWTCDFTNQFTQQCARTLHFTDAEMVRELAQRGKALTDLSSKNNFEHGIRNGGGGVILELSDFQYDKLIGKESPCISPKYMRSYRADFRNGSMMRPDSDMLTLRCGRLSGGINHRCLERRFDLVHIWTFL